MIEIRKRDPVHDQTMLSIRVSYLREDYSLFGKKLSVERKSILNGCRPGFVGADMQDQL
jgi:hypothetical protein